MTLKAKRRRGRGSGRVPAVSGAESPRNKTAIEAVAAKRADQKADNFEGYSLEELKKTLEREQGNYDDPVNYRHYIKNILNYIAHDFTEPGPANPMRLMEEIENIVEDYKKYRLRNRQRIEKLKELTGDTRRSRRKG